MRIYLWEHQLGNENGVEEKLRNGWEIEKSYVIESFPVRAYRYELIRKKEELKCL